MSDVERVRAFIGMVRRRALLTAAAEAAGLAVAAALVTLLALALAAARVGPAYSWRIVTAGALFLAVAISLALGFLLPAYRLRSARAVARLAGERHPPLASDLLSAVELDVPDADSSEGRSASLTHAFFAAVADEAAQIPGQVLVPLRRTKGVLAIAASLAVVLLLSAIFSTETVRRGLQLLVHRPTTFEGAAVSRDPLISDVRITYRYPAYTGLPPQVVEGSTGDIIALRGTRVLLEMRPLRSVRRALLLMGESGEHGEIATTVNEGKLSATLNLSEDGVYRVWLAPLLGRPVRESRSHRIVVEADRPPEVDVSAPADRLELPVPRPIEVGYNARDDFGLGKIELVYRINDGPEQRQVLKDGGGARSVRGTTLFEPMTAMLTPGARVAYKIEARDRDDVSGSKLGSSRTLYVVIQNPRAGLDEHVAAEHEVLDRLINSLAGRIELGDKGESPDAPPLERLWRWRDLHETEESHLVLLGRLVDQERRTATLSKPLVLGLAGIADRLGKHMRQEGDLLKRLRSKADLGALTPALLGKLLPASALHTQELENAVLLLDDFIGRQRLEDLASLGKDLTDAHKRLQDLLARYRAAGDEALRRQIEREIRELRARIEELARKIAEVKARNEIAPDWMNMPDTRKAMEQAARLDSLLEKGDARSLSQALAELGDTLQSLQKQLDKNADEFSHERFPQENRAMAELMKKIGDLEGDQRNLAEDGQALAGETEADRARRMEAELDRFMTKLKQDLESLQRKISGPTPREAGPGVHGEIEHAREGVRQLRRLLPANEWAEARKEADRLASGLRRVQEQVAERTGDNKQAGQPLAGFSSQMRDAAALAQGVAADLAKLFPKPEDALTPSQRDRARAMAERQDNIGRQTDDLSQDVDKRQGTVPGAESAGNELRSIANQMRQAGKDLRQGAAKEGAGRAQTAAERLAKLRENLGQRGGSTSQASREPVRIPGADEYRAPREWRQELMEAMREKAPDKYRNEVRRYYEELVK